ncbi:mucin-4 [Oryzias melastigma]|uniref:mucin-4 n=1 Tax=Oryzias melastigma TaxID=30732 RepID=UPI00168D98AF|nr:mucin-4 [Oryzias melastigma]
MTDLTTVNWLRSILRNISYPIRINGNTWISQANISTVCSPVSDGYQCRCEDQYQWSCDQCQMYGACDQISEDSCGCIKAIPSDGNFCQSVDQYTNPPPSYKYVISVELNMTDLTTVNWLRSILRNISYPIRINGNTRINQANISTVCSPVSDGYQCRCEDQYQWSCDQCQMYGACDQISEDSCGCIKAIPSDGNFCQSVDQHTNPPPSYKYVISVELNMTDLTTVNWLRSILRNISYPIRINGNTRISQANISTVCSPVGDGYQCRCEDQYQWSCDQCQMYGACDQISEDSCGCIKAIPSDGNFCQSVDQHTNPPPAYKYVISVELNMTDLTTVNWLRSILRNISYPIRINGNTRINQANISTVCSPVSDGYQCRCEDQYQWSCDQCQMYGACDQISEDSCGCIKAIPSDGNFCQSVDQHKTPEVTSVLSPTTKIQTDMSTIIPSTAETLTTADTTNSPSTIDTETLETTTVLSPTTNIQTPDKSTIISTSTEMLTTAVTTNSPSTIKTQTPEITTIYPPTTKIQTPEMSTILPSTAETLITALTTNSPSTIDTETPEIMTVFSPATNSQTPDISTTIPTTTETRTTAITTNSPSTIKIQTPEITTVSPPTTNIQTPDMSTIILTTIETLTTAVTTNIFSTFKTQTPEITSVLSPTTHIQTPDISTMIPTTTETLTTAVITNSPSTINTETPEITTVLSPTTKIQTPDMSTIIPTTNAETLTTALTTNSPSTINTETPEITSVSSPKTNILTQDMSTIMPFTSVTMSSPSTTKTETPEINSVLTSTMNIQTPDSSTIMPTTTENLTTAVTTNSPSTIKTQTPEITTVSPPATNIQTTEMSTIIPTTTAETLTTAASTNSPPTTKTETPEITSILSPTTQIVIPDMSTIIPTSTETLTTAVTTNSPTINTETPEITTVLSPTTKIQTPDMSTIIPTTTAETLTTAVTTNSPSTIDTETPEVTSVLSPTTKIQTDISTIIPSTAETLTTALTTNSPSTINTETPEITTVLSPTTNIPTPDMSTIIPSSTAETLTTALTTNSPSTIKTETPEITSVSSPKTNILTPDMSTIMPFTSVTMSSPSTTKTETPENTSVLTSTMNIQTPDSSTIILTTTIETLTTAVTTNSPSTIKTQTPEVSTDSPNTTNTHTSEIPTIIPTTDKLPFTTSTPIIPTATTIITSTSDKQTTRVSTVIPITSTKLTTIVSTNISPSPTLTTTVTIYNPSTVKSCTSEIPTFIPTTNIPKTSEITFIPTTAKTLSTTMTTNIPKTKTVSYSTDKTPTFAVTTEMSSTIATLTSEVAIINPTSTKTPTTVIPFTTKTETPTVGTVFSTTAFSTTAVTTAGTQSFTTDTFNPITNKTQISKSATVVSTTHRTTTIRHSTIHPTTTTPMTTYAVKTTPVKTQPITPTFSTISKSTNTTVSTTMTVSSTTKSEDGMLFRLRIVIKIELSVTLNINFKTEYNNQSTSAYKKLEGDIVTNVSTWCDHITLHCLLCSVSFFKKVLFFYITGKYECILNGNRYIFHQEVTIAAGDIKQAPLVRVDSQRNVKCQPNRKEDIQCCVQSAYKVIFSESFTIAKPGKVLLNSKKKTKKLMAKHEKTLYLTLYKLNLRFFWKILIFTGPVTCDNEQYGKGQEGDEAEVMCPEGQEGYKKAKCQGDMWKVIEDKCILTKIKELFIESEGLMSTNVKNFSQNLKDAVLNNKMEIASSSETINTIVNILNTIAEVSDAVSKDVMENVLQTVDVLIGDDAKPSWAFLNSNTSQNASSELLGSLESLSIRLNDSFEINTPLITLVRTTFTSSFAKDLNSTVSIEIPFSDNLSANITTILLSTFNNVIPPRNSTSNSSFLNDTSNPVDGSPGTNSVFLVNTDKTVNNVTLKFKKINESLPLDRSFQCVFWNFELVDETGAWDDEGCTFVSRVNGTVTCNCTHLTSFSILMATSIPEDIRDILDIITYIGVGISLASLVICLIIEGYVWRAVTTNTTALMRHISIVNTALSLLIADICFIIAASYSQKALESKDGDHKGLIGQCTAVTFFMHFFYLALFFWMLVSGLLIFYRTVMVFSHMSKSIMIAIGFVVGYGCPLIIAVTTVAATAPSQTYIRKNYTCWLNWTESKALLSLVIPALVIVVINIIVVIVVLCKMMRRSSGNTIQPDEKNSFVVIIRCLAILTPLFGLTWALGIGTMVSPKDKGIHIAFAFFNSLQGLFILIFGTLFDSKTVIKFLILQAETAVSEE